MQLSAQVSTLGDPTRNAIEDIRVLATVLLVMFHVIGLPNTGLELQGYHPLRIFADLLADFRMPAFAFIAGFIYALRPPTTGGFGAFAVGKLRRIAVPGLIAAVIFNGLSAAMHLSHALPAADLWQIIVFPYAHYWFLQAILALFCVIGIADALTRHRAELPLLALAVLLAASGFHGPALFSLDSAVTLAPFFMIGICFYRHSAWIGRRRRALSWLGLLLITLWLGWTLLDYDGLHALPLGVHRVRALMFGTSLCTLILFYWPHRALAKPLGRLSFTIYLYHVLGTASMRMLLHTLGVASIPFHVVAGTAAGLLLPIALHLIAIRWPISSQLILGIRQKSPTRPSAAPVSAPPHTKTALATTRLAPQGTAPLPRARR